MIEVSFRQSTLTDLDECPERGRLVLSNEMPRIETDAAAVGTSVHAGIEWLLGSLNFNTDGVEHAIFVACGEFDRICQMENFQWKKYTGVPQCVKMIRAAIMSWVQSTVEFDWDPIGMEIGFKDILLFEDEDRRITIEGTIDYFDAALGPWDWKTTSDGRKYQRGFGGDSWKLDRWNIQSTVYTKALVELGFLDPEGPWQFTFGGLVLPSGTWTPHTVTRTAGDHEWLTQKCLVWADMMTAGLEHWPMTDNQALCSPKWCPAWDQCKGKHVDDLWPLRSQTQF